MECLCLRLLSASVPKNPRSPTAPTSSFSRVSHTFKPTMKHSSCLPQLCLAAVLFCVSSVYLTAVNRRRHRVAARLVFCATAVNDTFCVAPTRRMPPSSFCVGIPCHSLVQTIVVGNRMEVEAFSFAWQQQHERHVFLPLCPWLLVYVQIECFLRCFVYIAHSQIVGVL